MTYGTLTVTPVAARFVGIPYHCSPQRGARGIAFPLCDLEQAMSGDHMPWMFFPDRDERGYYVTIEEIELETLPA